MAVTEDMIYEKCGACHLFVEDNPAFGDYPGIAEYVHLHRGDDADESLDETHQAQPSGLFANLATWKSFGPIAMQKRFTDNDPEKGHVALPRIDNRRDTFQSPYEQYADRVGQPFEIIGAKVENLGAGDDELVLYVIRFEDGMVADAWPEEVDADEIWQPTERGERP